MMESAGLLESGGRKGRKTAMPSQLRAINIEVAKTGVNDDSEASPPPLENRDLTEQDHHPPSSAMPQRIP